MFLFYIIAMIYGSQSLSLQSVDTILTEKADVSVNASKPSDLLTKMKSNPKEFVEEVETLDPAALQTVTELIENLLQTSEEEEQALIDDLAVKVAALDEANTNIVNAEESLDNANQAVTEAEAIAGAAETQLEHLREIHVEKTNEKANSQANHDKEIDGLDKEQEVLTEVLNLLNGFHVEKTNEKANSKAEEAQEASTVAPSTGTILQADELVLQQGRLITTLPKLPIEFVISFDVKPNTFVNAWQSVVHFSAGDNDHSNTPGLWFDHQNGVIHICFSGLCYNTRKIALGEWTTIQISRTASGVYSVEENGNKYFSRQINNPIEFTNVPVYASAPWWPALDGSIRNFRITLPEE